MNSSDGVSEANECHRTGISGGEWGCGENCPVYMIYEQCGFLEEEKESEDERNGSVYP